MDSTSNRSEKYFISKSVDDFFSSLHDIGKFTVQFFKEAFTPPFEWQEVIKQCYQVGYKSFSLITLTAFITGIVFTKQSRPSLASFGATSWLPSLIGIAIIKALAPLI
ncbi:MAG TPA: ABC transporter permease, partial [Chitinophagaceae bacterium]